jgi:hypothetical protein
VSSFEDTRTKAPEKPKLDSTSLLYNLPQELIDQIFEEIDGECTSICLGLTCTKFWACHRASPHGSGTGKGDLFSSAKFEQGLGSGSFLYQLLREWMGNQGYEYMFRRNRRFIMKFVLANRSKRSLELERIRDEETLFKSMDLRARCRYPIHVIPIICANTPRDQGTRSSYSCFPTL